MSGRHKIRNTKRAWRQRAEQLAEDLTRSEQAREALLTGRNQLLEEVRRLSMVLGSLQKELGTEDQTVQVQVAASSGPVHLLKPPETGSIPLQRPDGKWMAVPVPERAPRPSQGRSRGQRPTWATG